MSRILVTVGTDHHPFQRLVDWADAFAREHPQHEVFTQFGSARPPHHGEHSSLLDYAQLQRELARADAVVCHGGPATITEARRAGLHPICVPRDPGRGEHVDDHQLRFATRIGQAGLVDTRLDVGELDEVVAEALRQPRGASDEPDATAPGVGRLHELLSALTPHPMTEDQPIRVLYLGGQGRSGSTLLERALGELPGVVGVGEMVHLWERGLRDDQLCGCGKPFGSCEFWAAVGDRAFEGWNTLDAGEAVALRFGVDRNRYLPLLARPGLSTKYQQRHRRYVERLALLYRAIAEVSGARVVVDSSKHASYAMTLARVPGIDLRLLHVVRDSRGVAHAWAKEVARPEARGIPMPMYGPAKSAFLWDAQNVVIERLQRHHRYLRVRYEDFVEAPKDALLGAARFAGIDDEASALHFLDGDMLHLTSSHTVAGNPMRFTTGEVRIKSDQSWRTDMPAARQRLVSALTLPLQRHYGYGTRNP